MTLAPVRPAVQGFDLRVFAPLRHELVAGPESSEGAATAEAASVKEADARIRTADPFITSEVLYQLSYVGGEGS